MFYTPSLPNSDFIIIIIIIIISIISPFVFFDYVTLFFYTRQRNYSTLQKLEFVLQSY